MLFKSTCNKMSVVIWTKECCSLFSKDSKSSSTNWDWFGDSKDVLCNGDRVCKKRIGLAPFGL